MLRNYQKRLIIKKTKSMKKLFPLIGLILLLSCNNKNRKQEMNENDSTVIKTEKLSSEKPPEESEYDRNIRHIKENFSEIEDNIEKYIKTV